MMDFDYVIPMATSNHIGMKKTACTHTTQDVRIMLVVKTVFKTNFTPLFSYVAACNT